MAKVGFVALDEYRGVTHQVCECERHAGLGVVRRVRMAWLVLVTRLAVGDCCGFPDSRPPWPQG